MLGESPCILCVRHRLYVVHELHLRFADRGYHSYLENVNTVFVYTLHTVYCGTSPTHASHFNFIYVLYGGKYTVVVSRLCLRFLRIPSLK